MIAVRAALVVFIATCAAVSFIMGSFNGASLLGVLALLALVATSERVRALGRGIIADAYGDEATDRSVLDVLDRPATRFSAGADFGDESEAGTPRVGGWFLAPDGCPCPVDHTDACPLDDDVDDQRAA